MSISKKVGAYLLVRDLIAELCAYIKERKDILARDLVASYDHSILEFDLKLVLEEIAVILSTGYFPCFLDCLEYAEPFQQCIRKHFLQFVMSDLVVLRDMRCHNCLNELALIV